MIALADAPAGRAHADHPVDPALPPCDRVVALHLHLSPAGWTLDPANAGPPPLAGPAPAPPRRGPLPIPAHDPIWSCWRPEDLLTRLQIFRRRPSLLQWLARQLGWSRPGLLRRLRGQEPLSDEDLTRICVTLELGEWLTPAFCGLVACWQRPTGQQRRAAIDELCLLHEEVAAHRGEALPFRRAARIQSRAVALLQDQPPEQIAAILALPEPEVRRTLDDLAAMPWPPGPVCWLGSEGGGLAPRLAEEGLTAHQATLLQEKPGVLDLQSGVWAVPGARVAGLRAATEALRAEIAGITSGLQGEAGPPVPLYLWYGLTEITPEPGAALEAGG